MSLQDHLLREIRIGDSIEIMCDMQKICGRVVALDIDTLTMQTDAGERSVLSLDTISSYQFVGAEDAAGNVEETEKNTFGNVSEGNSSVRTEESEGTRLPSAHMLNDQTDAAADTTTGVMAANDFIDYDVLFLDLSERGNSFFDAPDIPTVQSFRTMTFEHAAANVQTEMRAIQEHIVHAMDELHETSPEEGTIHESIVKIKQLYEQHPNAKEIQDFLGALYYECHREIFAIKAYERGGDAISAFAAAMTVKNKKKMRVFAVRHFAAAKDLHPYIVKHLLTYMMEKETYRGLERVLDFYSMPERWRAYHSVLRALLLRYRVPYRSELDAEVSPASLQTLLYILCSEAPIFQNVFADLSGLRKLFSAATPSFAAAEYARKVEKNLPEARKLYVDAIHRGEKIPASVVHLCRVLIELRELNTCKKYMQQYRSQIYDKTYENLKRLLQSAGGKMSLAPASPAENTKHRLQSMGGKSSALPVPTPPAGASPATEYFPLARRADVEEKNLPKAIMYYQKAIEAKERLQGSVPDLAAIYARLEMYDEALALLEAHWHGVLSEQTYLNIKQTIFSKAKDRKYLADMRAAYTRQMSFARSREKQNTLRISQVTLLIRLEEYPAALKILSAAAKNCRPKNYAAQERYTAHLLQIQTAYCRIYSHLGEDEKARDYAQKILALHPTSTIAQNVLSGQLEDVDEIFDESMGDWLKNKVDNISLDAEVRKKNLLKDGVFIGTESEAASILEGIRYNESNINDEARSNSYFAGAKLIRQLLDGDAEITQTEEINEQKYCDFVSMGSYFYGNAQIYRPEPEDRLDTARYFYIQSLRNGDAAKQADLYWFMATARYMETYFDEITAIRKEGILLRHKFSSKKAAPMAQIQEIMSKPLCGAAEYFVAGLLEMLYYNEKAKGRILEKIYDSAYFDEVFEILVRIVGVETPRPATKEEFEALWKSAAKRYFSDMSRFLRMVHKAIDTVFTVGALGTHLESLDRAVQEMIFSRTNREVVREIYGIFNTISDYHTASDFDYKAARLSAAEERRKQLLDKIEEYPTQFSYESMVPALERLGKKMDQEAAQFYSDAAPELSVKISDSSVDEEALLVRVPIAVFNRANAQGADNVQLAIVGDDAELINDMQLRKWFLPGNGIPKEEFMVFRITPEILEDRSFSISISISYQYKVGMHSEIQEKEMSTVLTVSLDNREKFEPIDNPFELHKNGAAVKDPNMFYGRDQEIEDIIAQISDPAGNLLRGRCLALYGQTRTGKSSLLFHIERRLRENNPEGNIVVNIGSIGEQDLSKNIMEFLYTILDEMKKEIVAHHANLLPKMRAAGIEMNADRLTEHPEHAQMYFNAEFKRVCMFLEEEEKTYNVVVMIDEFTYIYDWIRKGIMTDRIMKFWKAFIQNNGIFAIIIGQDHMMKFVRDSEFTNDFGSTELHKVTYLPEEDAKKLMDEPIQFDDAEGKKVSRYKDGALDRLYELTSGSAFLIMNLCAGLVDYLNRMKSVYITRAHIDDYLKTTLPTFEESRFFEPQYADKSKPNDNEINKNMLRRIAQRSNKKDWTPLKRLIEKAGDRRVLDDLALRDVIRIENNERCKILVSLYKEWILATYGTEEIHG